MKLIETEKWSNRDIEDIVGSYLGTALWSTTAEDGETNYDDIYNVSQIDNKGLKQATKNVKEFLEKAIMLNQELIYELGLDNEQLGHDIWLSTNGHGAGFFDGQWDSKDGTIQLGDYLQNIARKLKLECDPWSVDEDTWSLE